MPLIILAWQLAGLLRLRRTEQATDMLGIVDFFGAFSVCSFVLTPVSVIIERLGISGPPTHGPLVLLFLFPMFVVMMALLATWIAFVQHIRLHNRAEFSRRNQKLLAILAWVVRIVYFTGGLFCALLIAGAVMMIGSAPWYIGALVFAGAIFLGDQLRQAEPWGIRFKEAPRIIYVD